MSKICLSKFPEDTFISKDDIQEDKSPFPLNWEPKKIDSREEHLSILLSKEENMFFPYTVGKGKVMNGGQRNILVMWYIELTSDTSVDKDLVVHKAVRMTDMYFTNMRMSMERKKWVKKKNWQKIGQALLHISQESVGLSTIKMAVNSTIRSDHTYTQKEIYDTEYGLLIKEIWKNGLFSPFEVTFYDFVYLATQNSSEKQRDFARYLSFLCLLDIDLCYETPSRVASAILNRVSKKFPKFTIESYISEKLGSPDPKIVRKIKALREEDRETEDVLKCCVERKKYEEELKSKKLE